MKIKSVLSSRRRRSPTKSAPEPWLHEPEPKQPEQPDMLSKILLLTPATDESRATAETTNESDESRTAAATANESIEIQLKTAVDASINSTFFSPRPQAKSEESKPTASEPDETNATPTTTNEPNESQNAAATASEPDMFSVLSSVISEAKSIGDDLSRLLVEEVNDLKTTAEPAAKPTAEPAVESTAEPTAATESEPELFAVLSSVISEAKCFGDDASRLIGEQVGDMKTETESVIKRTAKVISVGVEDWRLKHLNQTQTDAESVSSAEWSVSSEQNKVKGHSHWAKEIKKLGQLERKKENTEKQITKCDEQITKYENIISTLEEEQVETRKKIKALHQKAMPSGGSNQDEANGSMSDCATEVKKLGQLEQKKEKAEKQLAKADKEMTKLEKILSVTEQKHQETMKNINFQSKYYRCDDDSVMSWESRV